MSILTRNARRSDAPALANLAAQLGYPTAVSDIRRRLELLVGKPDERVIVAVDDADAVVGWTTARAAEHMYGTPCVEISGFVVDQGSRGRGVGRTMMAEVERWAAATGFSTIRLSANVKRKDALRFYQALSFRKMKQQFAFQKDLERAAPARRPAARGKAAAVRITGARPADAPEIAALMKALSDSEDGEGRTTAAYVRQYLADPACTVLLARVGGRAAGLVSYSLRSGLYHAGRSLYIEDLVVEPASRGLGIGTLLVDRVRRTAEAKGCKELSVSTSFANQKAIGLYERFGMRERSLLLEKHLPGRRKS